MKTLIDKLEENRVLTKNEFVSLLEFRTPAIDQYLFRKSDSVRHAIYGNTIYIRGLIEFTNICKNDCYYCGIRKSNKNCDRYRLTKEEILSCCKTGYELGFRTFVLQGGEDSFFTDDYLVAIISDIKQNYPECAITLSIGERSYQSYKELYKAGADRYLLRQETDSESHYNMLHPSSLSLSHRKKCLYDLKEIGYEVGCGFMVGSPYQTYENLAEDLLFIHDFEPHMVGIGPFIPQKDTPFGGFKQGSLELNLFLIGLLRLMSPNLLIPATTALGTIDPKGREKGILAGANVVMPNLSPITVRNKYLLYDNKICTGDEAAECHSCLSNRMSQIGYKIVESRGDMIQPNDLS